MTNPMTSGVLSDNAVRTTGPSVDRLRQHLQAVDRSETQEPLASLGLPAMVLLSMAAATYVAQLFLAIVAGRHLYGDGSWFLIKMLSENHVAIWNVHGWHDFFVGRFGAFAYQEYPTLLAARLHVRNPKLLSLIYGTTLFSFKPLSILLCYRFARDKRLVIFPLLTLFAVTMNSEVYLVSETHLMTALFWPALFGLLFCRELKGFNLVAMIVVSAPLLLCYEAMAIYSPFLCAACVYRYFAIANCRRERWLCGIFFVWYGVSTVLAVLAIVFPRDASNREGFLRSLLFIFRHNHVSARVSCIILVLCGLIILIPERFRKALNGLTALAVLCSLAIPVYIIRHPQLTHFGMHILARTMNASVPLVLTCAFVVVFLHLMRIGMAQYKKLFVVAAVLGMCQCGWSMVATMQWSNMLTMLRAELRTHSGPLPLEQTSLYQSTVDGQPMRNLHADWPVMSLSILYSDDRMVRTIILPPPTAFLPFDPFAAALLPDLSHYGIRYDVYREVLAHRWQYSLGETLTFTRGGSAALFMRGSWQNAEDWATWGGGPDFGLDLPISDERLPKTVLLTAMVAPNLSPSYRELAVQVLVNNVALDTWTFEYSPDIFTTRAVQIPRDVLALSNPVQIRFRALGPVHSPSEMGKGQDPRKLSLAFVKLKLSGAQ